ncbi:MULTISPECIES: glutathione S-transferase family protein [unclassified Roseivivax]|uniref:glutathione S-transferase family protein n=1 Tax=Roseivivax sp. GX 12232 TaxID=2900547 RepID=UPI001E455A9A|nr:glutathione S-transferase [Roseivivax sp. GX 12232]MCE0506016.1 glutathione S-transferase [Roseivivax sp. GX 12232]
MRYTLIGTAKTRAFRPLWLLEELGVDYEHLPVGPQSAEVREASPLGKVPVLLADGRAIPDSAAILTFLADRHGAFTCPAGTPERAVQDSWTFRILDELDAIIWTAARHSFVLPEDKRVPEVKDSLKSEFAANLERITAGIEGPYIMGEEMTVPDIILCHCGGWARVAKFPDPPEAFKAYTRRLRDREAYRRAAALP